MTTTEHYADELHRDKLSEASRRIFGQLVLPRGTIGEQKPQNGTNGSNLEEPKSSKEAE